MQIIIKHLFMVWSFESLDIIHDLRSNISKNIKYPTVLKKADAAFAAQKNSLRLSHQGQSWGICNEVNGGKNSSRVKWLMIFINLVTIFPFNCFMFLPHFSSFFHSLTTIKANIFYLCLFSCVLLKRRRHLDIVISANA